MHMACVPAGERSHQSQHGDGEERFEGGVEKAATSIGAVLAPTRRTQQGEGESHHGNGAVVLPPWS